MRKLLSYIFFCTVLAIAVPALILLFLTVAAIILTWAIEVFSPVVFALSFFGIAGAVAGFLFWVHERVESTDFSPVSYSESEE